MLKYNATVISTTGAPGTGKTYSRCARFLWDWWMPEEQGVHWSNFPVNIAAFEQKFHDAAERIKIIPADVLVQWSLCDGVHGPWEFFHDIDIQGAHIAIDECHNYIRRTGKGSVNNAERWQRWLGEIRHRGCSVEFLSQDPHKVHPVVEQHSAVRIQLVNSEDRRDPVFKILLGDWYEVRASISREYETVIWQLEERRINGKWKKSDVQRFTLEPGYFRLYDSFNTPQTGGGKATGQLREFQKRSRVNLWLWFLKRNFFRLVSRLVLACVMLWVCFLGGGVYLINEFNKWVMSRAGTRPAGAPVTESTFLRVKRPVVAAPAPAAASVAETPKSTSVSVKVPIVAPETIAIPATVRSETLQHHTLEMPPSAEMQQAALPRVLLLGDSFVSLDDGMMVYVGEFVGAFELVSVDYRRRMCFFEGRGDENGVRLCVPVGGPVGLRLRGKKTSEYTAPSGIAKIVPRAK